MPRKKRSNSKGEGGRHERTRRDNGNGNKQARKRSTKSTGKSNSSRIRRKGSKGQSVNKRAGITRKPRRVSNKSQQSIRLLQDSLRKLESSLREIGRSLSTSSRVDSERRRIKQALVITIGERANADNAAASIRRLQSRVAVLEQEAKAEYERQKAIQERKEAREKARRDEALAESEIVTEILRRRDGESSEDYVKRVDDAMRKLGFHHDAWYQEAALLWSMTDQDMYSTILGSPPQLGTAA